MLGQEKSNVDLVPPPFEASPTTRPKLTFFQFKHFLWLGALATPFKILRMEDSFENVTVDSQNLQSM